MSIPDWADEQLSKELPVLRGLGENQDLEYMESLPKKPRDLGKEIAAFATSNPGTILIGVSNNGDLVGLQDCQASEGRDRCLRWIEGISHGTIKPAVTPTTKYAIEDEKVVLVILVPKGSQPIYYSRNTPYLRHISESRPAEPHEVIELINKYSSRQAPEGEVDQEYTTFFTRLASVLIDVIIYGEEADQRDINPWLDLWRAQFKQASSEFREMAAEDMAVKEDMSVDLSELADLLDDAANMFLTLGCGPELEGKVNRALHKARELKTQLMCTIPVSDASLEKANAHIIKSSRKLAILVKRADTMIEQGRAEELQSEASSIGYELLRLCNYQLGQLQGQRERLKTVALDLHLVETARLYMDGGRSMEAILDRLRTNSQILTEVADQTDKN